MKILLRDCNAKVGREYIFKPTIGNKRVRKIVMIMVLGNFATSKNLVFKGTMFPNQNKNTYKHT